MKVLVAHPGTQYSYHLVRELEKHGLLYQFWTGFTIPSDGLLGNAVRLLPLSFRRKINNRMLDNVTARKIHMNFFLELHTLWQLRKGNNREGIFFFRNKRFQERIPDAAILGSDIIVGYDTSSWILAARCKSLNRKFILDVSIPHPRTKLKVYQKILNDYPDWAFALQQKNQELIELEEKEMQLASQIVVASTFSKNSMIENGIAATKITVIPYGVDSNAFNPITVQKKGPIRFVFVGLVDARKGVPLLLDAWSRVKKTDESLTLIGPVTNEARDKICQSDPSIQITGSVSLDELKKILPTFDVMVFPSYFEGFGLVILEAMASGLMVITTEATCAPDIVAQNKDGATFQSGNSEGLKNQIQDILNHKEKLIEYSRSARYKALLYSWAAYGDRWLNTLKNYDFPKNKLGVQP